MEVSPGLYQRILHRVPKFIFSSVYDGSKGTLIIRVLEFSTARGGRAEESVSNRRIMDGQEAGIPLAVRTWPFQLVP